MPDDQKQTTGPTYVDRLDLHEGKVDLPPEKLDRKLSGRLDREQTTPIRIWLLLHEGECGSHVWCDDPNPSGNGEHEAVEYIRADVVRDAIAAMANAPR